MSSRPVLAPDAAIALGIASTAMPFARTRHDEVERWLRVLRLHGQVGIALQALGVSEAALTGGDPSHGHDAPPAETTTSAGAASVEGTAQADAGAAQADVVALVTEHAVRIADVRRARALSTRDILMAVMHVYGEDFDRVLHVHGTDRDEVLARLELLDASPR
jgi:hypothetical protein